jgi:hypothetical protein
LMQLHEDARNNHFMFGWNEVEDAVHPYSPVK